MHYIRNLRLLSHEKDVERLVSRGLGAIPSFPESHYDGGDTGMWVFDELDKRDYPDDVDMTLESLLDDDDDDGDAIMKEDEEEKVADVVMVAVAAARSGGSGGMQDSFSMQEDDDL